MAYKYKVVIECFTFNHEKYLADALDGFVMQRTDFPFVAVVIDDCSTDGTSSVLKYYETKYPDIIKAVYLQENHYSRGKSKWPYLKPYISESEYIAICEGDDFWTDPQKIQKQVDFLDNHQDFGLCMSAFSCLYEAAGKDIDVIQYDTDEITIDDILQGRWLGTLTAMYRRSVRKQYVPPFSDMQMGDLPLWGFFATYSRIGYLREVTGTYRSLCNSASHFSDQEKQFCFTLDEMRIRDYYARINNKKDIVQPVITKKARYILDNSFANKVRNIPLELLWHFLDYYSSPSGYDRAKYWGLKYRFIYPFSWLILKIRGKI